MDATDACYMYCAYEAEHPQTGVKCESCRDTIYAPLSHIKYSLVTLSPVCSHQFRSHRRGTTVNNCRPTWHTVGEGLYCNRQELTCSRLAHGSPCTTRAFPDLAYTKSQLSNRLSVGSGSTRGVCTLDTTPASVCGQF